MTQPAVVSASASAHVRSDLELIRDLIIAETFGGPNMYRLLKERNPQLEMLLNAGIVAGVASACGTTHLDARRRLVQGE